MPKLNRPSRSERGQNNSFSALFDRVNSRFPNFLLGLTVFVLVVLVGSLFLQNKEISSLKLPDVISNILTGNKEEAIEETTRSYVVKKGDTLWSIAEEAYGSGYNAYDLAQANKITNPNSLNEGTRLLLPALEPKDPTRGELASGVFTTKEETPQVEPRQNGNSQTKVRSYRIVSGETLWAISMKVYGDPYRWTDIWKANPSVWNPDLIYAGNTLTLP